MSFTVAVLNLQARLISDPYLTKIPSLQKTKIAFHAKDDSPEVRYEFFKLIQQLDFKTQFIVCRKRENTFRSRHKGKTSKFYDDLVTNLFIADRVSLLRDISAPDRASLCFGKKRPFSIEKAGARLLIGAHGMKPTFTISRAAISLVY